ncbi:MAG: protease modulator HflC [Pseudomonadota bacterium]|nr:protease modulator HflC [Gammaproteobacteria bacterium]MEC9359164.1 protease modulator HflC [Pseudomonadota bacterium]
MSNRQLFSIALALIAVFVLYQTFYIVDQRERVIKLRFGEVIGVDSQPGVHFKWPIADSVRRMDSRVLTLDNQSEDFLTSEKKSVKVDFYAKWRIQDTRTYYRATAGLEINANDRLASIVNRALRDQFSIRTIRQVVSDERDDIMKAVEDSTAEKVDELGIQLVDVRVKAIDLPDNVSDSVYQRMRSERQRVASDFRARGSEEAEKIRADADREAAVIVANAYKEAERIRGEGDAKAAEIYATAYNKDAEFYSFYRSLDVYRNTWNGQQDLMVLEPSSELFKYFKNPAGR